MATKAEMLQHISKLTGLTKATVRDLLKSGWTFHDDQIGKYFMQPQAKLRGIVNA